MRIPRRLATAGLLTLLLTLLASAALAWSRGILGGPRLYGETKLWTAFTAELRELGKVQLPGELDGYRQLARAISRWPAGRRQVEALARRTDGVGYQACLVLARSREARQRGTAAEYYRRALELRPDPAVREELAHFLEDTGRGAEAVAEWKQLLPARTAVEALLRLEDWSQIARWLNDRSSYQRALDLLREHGETQARLDPRVAREWGRALLGLGEARAALPWLSQYLQQCPEDKDALSAYALALEKSGKLDKAEQAYARLGAAGARGLGRVLQRLGRPREAAAAFLRSPEPEARWQGARLLEEVDRSPEALEAYRQLAREASPVQDDAALRAYVLLRRRGQEAAEFRALISPGLAWTAGITRSAAITRSAGINGDSLPHPPQPDPPPPPTAQIARSLVKTLGKRGVPLAQVEMEILGRHGGPEGKLALAAWYAERGNSTLATEVAMAALPQIPTPTAYRLAYPLPFADTVEEVASHYGVDPLLLWAVMREESHFAPWAISPAGACGLMQLMPATAQMVARALGLDLKEDDLFQPETNLRLGAWYLARLLESCGGNIPKAVAAYNGGLGNVRRWEASPVFAGREGFPTAISFPETREYLARVTQSYLVYRHLYADD